MHGLSIMTAYAAQLQLPGLAVDAKLLLQVRTRAKRHSHGICRASTAGLNASCWYVVLHSGVATLTHPGWQHVTRIITTFAVSATSSSWQSLSTLGTRFWTRATPCASRGRIGLEWRSAGCVISAIRVRRLTQA